MLRGAAACVYRACRGASSGALNGGVNGALILPSSNKDGRSFAVRWRNICSRGMCSGDKGAVRSFESETSRSDDQHDEDGPLGRIMTEERMRKQLASSQDVNVLHRLQRLSRGRERFSSLEYSPFQAKINANAAMARISIASDPRQKTEKNQDNLPQAHATDSPVQPIVESTSAERLKVSQTAEDSESPSASSVRVPKDGESHPSAVASVKTDNLGINVGIHVQRIHLSAIEGRSLEFSMGCNLLSEGLVDKLKHFSHTSPSDLDRDEIFASSVVKKRRKKMNKHKYKKRRKRDRARDL